MKTIKFFPLLFAILFITGCNTKNKDVSTDISTAPRTGESYDIVDKGITGDADVNDGRLTKYKSTTSEGSVVTQVSDELQESKFNVTDRMIIRSGNMSIEIEKFDDTERIISEKVSQAKGFITNSTSNLNASGKKQGIIEVRIPAENYDSFISGIQGIGKVMSQNISGRDVTEEYIDLEARQITQRELEKRLIGLLNEKTAKLVDVVEVEEKLSSVRENIERTEGRMRFLKNQSAFSTLKISLFEPSVLQTSTGGGFFYELGQAVKKGLNGFTEILAGLITFFIAFLPVLIFIGIIAVILRKILVNRKRRKEPIGIQST